MIYKMKIQEESLNLIKSGDKTIEVRISNKERRNLQKEDIIEFIAESEKLFVKVMKVEEFSTFEEMIDSNNLNEFGSKGRFSTKEEFLDILKAVYPKIKDKILAIHVKSTPEGGLQ